MELRVLGPLELVGDTGPVSLGGKVRAVLALLAVHVGESVAEDRLVEVLWRDSAPRTATKTLQSYVSRLRRALGDGDDGLVIETTPGGYRLRAAVDVLDVARVEALAAQAREATARGDHPWAAVALSEALRTWRGAPLEEFSNEPWAAAESARLVELREVLVEERVDAELASGRHAALVPELEALTAQHPLRERLWGQRMVALYRSGRQADALRVFQQVRTLLADELGIEPGHELRQLEQQVLDQDRTLDAPPTGPAATAASTPALPSGVVTFLLTDVESSTALWDENPEAMAAALAQHDMLVGETVEAHGGTLVKSRGEGDSTFSVFATAEAAANAATAIHAALAADGFLRIRIGIHTGEAEERDGDYFGPTVNRAARMRDAAHGGQTICSSLTGQLLLDGVRRVEVVDLGEHRLRDLERSDRIFQIGDGTFLPLRALDAHRHNLPEQATGFVGREPDIEEIAALLDDNRLVVLTGVGGVGKTRLAIEVAASIIDRMRDGVFFIDLAPVSEPASVVPTIANVLSFGLGAADTEADLLAHLAKRNLLVVLDNCEHLIDTCASLLAKVLAMAGTSRVLATSREALGLSGERDWQVPSLEESEGRALFAMRATAVRSSFKVDESNAHFVDEICGRLDGIPLAIELAAARVSHLHPQQIADRLNDRFTLLTGGRGRIQRQHTLQTALDWSHDLLEPPEQVLLRRLGAFNGSFGLEAAERVCSDDRLPANDVLHVLGALVNQSLVETRSDGRYRLLETVRLYAEQRLIESGESEDVRDRHLDWLLAWVESLDAYRGPVTLLAERMEIEYDNVSTAIGWAVAQRRVSDAGRIVVATGPMWMWARHTHDAARWLASVLADPVALDPDLRVACLVGGCHNGAVLLTDDAWGLALAATRVPEATATGPLALAWGNVAQLSAVQAGRRHRDGVERVEVAVSKARSIHAGDDLWAAEALNLCAEAFLIVGRYADCVPLAQQSEEIAKAIGVMWLTTMNRRLLAVAWHLSGEHARAMEAATRVFEDPTAGLGSHEAVVLAADGQLDRARERALQNLAWASEYGHIPLHDAETVITLGCIEAIAGDYERAATILAAARALGRQYSAGFRTPASWALYAHYVPLVRTALGPDQAAHARERGRAMTLDDAVRYAGSRPEAP